MNLFESPGLNSAESIMHNMHKSLIKEELPETVGNSAIHRRNRMLTFMSMF